MPTAKKQETIEQVQKSIKDAKAVVLADYTGLTHKQLEELRRNLKTIKAEFTIVKNTLLKRAATGIDAVSALLKQEISGPTALLTAHEDEILPLKQLVQLAQTTTLKIKMGIVGGQEVSGEDVTRLSTLPPKNILLGQIVGGLKSPLYGLHYALSWNLRRFVYALEAVKRNKTA